MTLMIPIMMAILSSLRLNKILYQMQDTGCLHLPGCAIMFLTVCVCVSVKRLSGWWVGGRIGGVLRAVLPYPVIQMAIARVQFDLGKVIQAQ